MHQGMRNLQVRLIYRKIIVEENININGTVMIYTVP